MLSSQNIRNYVDQLYVMLDCVGGELPRFDYLLDKLRKLGIINTLHIFAGDPASSEEARLDQDTKALYIRQDIYDKAVRGFGRARFTIAHEIGHLMLGHQGTNRRTESSAWMKSAASKTREFEQEADAFAAEFLMPKAKVGDPSKWTKEELASKFGVSLPAAEIRLNELGQEFRKQSGQKRELPSCAVDFLKEAESRGYKIQHATLPK